MNFKRIFISLALSLGLLLTLGLVLVSASRAAPAMPQAELRVCASGCVYTTVQAAVDAAADGDVIEIATGVYSDVTTIAGLTQIAYVTKSLTLRGGYNISFTVWNPALYTTTFDAHGAGRVIYASGDISLTLDGLRLLNGFDATAGGGVYALNAHLRVLSSVIGNNRLSPNDTYNNYGVGLYLSGGSLYMQNSIVQDNQPIAGGDNSHDGGGLYGTGATVEIRDSQFLSNTAAFGSAYGDWGNGGGVFLENCASLLQGVTFRNNKVPNTNGGGGGLWTRDGSLSLLDSTFEGNTISGAALYTADMLISSNVFTGNLGSGLVLARWTTGLYNITVTHNLLQNNTGSGLRAGDYTLSLIVENNSFIGNQGGGLYLGAKSDTGMPSAVIVRGNLFQANTTTGNGGGAYLIGAVDVLFNRFIANHANGNGGGIYQGETSRNDNASAVYDGNLLRGNSATEGGGLYIRPEYSKNLDINYRNLALLDNTATSRGSAILIRAAAPRDFEHLTLAGNHGGDGSMVYNVFGGGRFTNTIFYNGTIGLSGGAGYEVSFDHVLRYNVVTPTVGSITDRSPITATPAFAADGYHLTHASAAVDAGLNIGVNDDIDGGPRPLGTAPDIGADESPYSRADTGVQASKLADAPQWKVYYTGLNVPPSTYFEQNYLMPFAYYSPITAPQITAYSIRDDFPPALNLTANVNPIGLSYVRSGQTLTWTSRAPLAPGEWGWVGVTGQSDAVTPDQIITNRGQLSYSLTNGLTKTIALSVTTQVPPRPVFPPVLITPLDGEMCLEAGNQLSAIGLAGAGMIIHLYEDGSDRAQTTATASGKFTLTWTSALTLSHPSIAAYTVACEPGGTCSTPSRTVSLSYPQADWCPQRSYWEGDAQGSHFTFYFRDDRGRYATNDFVLPGVYGFQNTQLHLYSCCDHNETNPFKVTADNVVYQTPSAHDGRMWTFTIGSAHTVIVESQCDGGGGGPPPPPPPPSHGQVLIDPDGFVFDVNEGGQYDPATGVFSPTQAIPGITVTAYVSVPEWGGWMPWPAQLYNNQINPQVTGDSGYFAFFTPPGFFYLQAEGPSTGSGQAGYQSWRSPVVQVITQIVHVNMPLTPWSDTALTPIILAPDGPSPSIVNVPLGGSVEWRSMLDASATITDLVSLTDNPLLRLLSARNPLTDTLGFDGGMLAPGQAYRRQFNQPGTYTYSEGQGHTGTIVVNFRVYLPLVMRQ